MIGALSIIRFRTNFKDPRDIIFMFASLAAGIACGVGGYLISVIGTVGFVTASFILHLAPLSKENIFDGMLRFNMENKKEEREKLEEILTSHCKTFALITIRDINQAKRLDYAYHIKMKPKKNSTQLIEALQGEILTIKGVSLMLQETTVDI